MIVRVKEGKKSKNGFESSLIVNGESSADLWSEYI